MGLQREYIEAGGFSSYLYTQKGESIVASNGVEGKVVEKIGGTAFRDCQSIQTPVRFILDETLMEK